MTAVFDATVFDLDAEEQRVLGCLLEKQRTVPASYPLTPNALRAACNQANSREPVVEYDDRTVVGAIGRLKDKALVRLVWAGQGQRTVKYHQILDEALDLSDAERAVLTVLLLRGAQAAGALKTRTDRLHAFADRSEVEDVLAALAARDVPLVQELAKRHGDKDTRWVHLLGPVEMAGVENAAAAIPFVNRESVIAEGGPARDAAVRTAYDATAVAYADLFADELEGKPFDQWLLQRVAAHGVSDPIVEVGSGPGQVAGFLAACGADVTGQDVSEAMVLVARERFPDVRFERGDLRQLMRPPAASGWGAVVSWYSLVHFAGSELDAVVAALARVLRPGGVLALATHVGTMVHHVEDFFGAQVDLHFVEHDTAALLRAVDAAGLEDVEWYHRGPLPGTREHTERLYVLARRPD